MHINLRQLKPRLGGLAKAHSKAVAVVIIGLFITSGLILQFAGRAATPFIAQEPEGGAITSPAFAISDVTASGDGAVRFADPGTRPINCVGNPSGCGYPDATNTGVPAGTNLTVMNLSEGYMDVTTPGTVIENKDIRGCLIIKAPNVIIRKSKVTCPSYSVIYNSRDYYSGGNLLIEDVDISCGITQGTGVSEYGFTARRVVVHDCENSFSISDIVTIEDSYLHSFYEGPTGDGHADGIQFGGVPYGIMIRHNTIFSYGATAAVNWTGQTTDVEVRDNFMGGGATTLYCPRITIPVGAFRVINNRFADKIPTGQLIDDCDGGDVTFTGNYRDSDLSTVLP